MDSFNGGVGRTLHGVALADAIARRGDRVLLVDADLEAPGITWMFSTHSRRVDFSYEDFLALLHSSEDGLPDDAVKLGTAYLPNEMVDNVIAMPVRRSLRDIAPPRLEPTDLLTPGWSIYYLTESLARLADRLDRTVLIDLPAGSSELTAPVLLDPRVQRIFVTTVSDQSLYGTLRTIQEVGRRAPTRADDPASVAVVIRFCQDGRWEPVTEAASLLATRSPERSNQASGKARIASHRSPFSACSRIGCRHCPSPGRRPLTWSGVGTSRRRSPRSSKDSRLRAEPRRRTACRGSGDYNALERRCVSIHLVGIFSALRMPGAGRSSMCGAPPRSTGSSSHRAAGRAVALSASRSSAASRS